MVHVHSWVWLTFLGLISGGRIHSYSKLTKNGVEIDQTFPKNIAKLYWIKLKLYFLYQLSPAKHKCLEVEVSFLIFICLLSRQNSYILRMIKVRMIKVVGIQRKSDNVQPSMKL